MDERNANEAARRKEVEDRQYAGAKPLPPGATPGHTSVLARAAMAGQCASESLASLAMHKASTAADDAIRHERFAQMLTPEIERTIFCLREGVALGLIDVRFIVDALQRPEIERLNRF